MPRDPPYTDHDQFYRIEIEVSMNEHTGGTADSPYEALTRRAAHAAKRSYSPYSHFRVGAALLCRDGTIHEGANVENRSYGLTVCAERNAVFAAVAAGNREFEAIAVYAADSETPIPPCGACRQVLSEFSRGELAVICVSATGQAARMILSDLLPHDSLHELRGLRASG